MTTAQLERKLRRIYLDELVWNKNNEQRLQQLYNEFEQRNKLERYEEIILETEREYWKLIEVIEIKC